MADVRIERTRRARCRRLLVALAFLLPPVAAGAQDAPPPEHETVVDVRIEGAETVSFEKLRPLIRTRLERPLDLNVVADDVKRLASLRAFVDVRPLYYRVPGGGVVVIFRILERPTLGYVKYVGNTKIRDKKIAERTELKEGEALDPHAVEEGRRQIEELYREKGFSKVHVTIFEGSDARDRGAIYVIHEGPKQKIRWVRFEGNTIVGDARLKTLIQSKPPILWLFRGHLEKEKIDQDVERLTAYYRSLGFFRARIGRDLDMDPNHKWLTLTFVIDEGPRYVVRDVSFVGNKKFSQAQLLSELELLPGQFFNQAQMTADVNKIQHLYGAEGHIYADVEADPRFLEEPGQLDLVYHLEEGARWRIGRINVNIKGENPHTRHRTVLNYVSLRPGDIADIRKKEASERRIGASRLFETNPRLGNPPQIIFRISEEQSELYAERTGNRARGQSPQPVERAGGGFTPSYRPYPQAMRRQTETGTHQGGVRNRAVRQQTTARPIVRGQYTPFGGQAVPSLDPRAPAGPVFQGPPPTTAPTTIYPPLTPGLNAPPVQASQPPLYSSAPPPGSITAQPFDASVPSYAPPVTAPPPGGYNPPLVVPSDPSINVYPEGGYPFLDPTTPEGVVDVDIIAEETTTGRFMFGVGVNSSAGLVGNIVIDEQNFDIWRFPRGWDDIRNATAWRGKGQRMRIELVPGTQVQRYLISFTEPYLFDTPVSLGVSGFFFDRIFKDWDEQRVGGRVSLGYEITPDLAAVASLRAENVNIRDPRVPTPPDLLNVLGDSDLYTGRIQLTHDTRDNAFLATEGHLVELAYEQGFGEFDFPRGSLDYRRYFLVRQRPDRSGRHVLSLRSRVAVTGNQTPLFERYFAGGFSTLRGFDFRGASPRVFNVVVGGEFMLLGSVEYMFPITADDMLRGVVFTDFGTVEESVKLESDDFRVAPGFGLRIQVPALGPAPIALDLAFPIAHEAGDEIENFTFFVGFGR